MFNNSYFFNLAVQAGAISNHLNVDIPLLNRIENYNLFLQTLCFIHANRQHITYVGNNNFQINHLQKIINLNKESFKCVETFLRFVDHATLDFEGQVHIKIENCDFIVPFPEGVVEVHETFNLGWYHLAVQDADVVDIGGFIGDTAVYFAKHGARKIDVYEPAIELCTLATKNVELNHVEKQIIIHNEAVADADGEETFYFNYLQPGSSSGALETLGPLINGYVKRHVKTVAVTKVLDKHVDLLKVDCEGAEHKIINAAHNNGLLENVDEAVIETHGDYCGLLQAFKLDHFRLLRQEKIDNNSAILLFEHKR